jgi:tRNA-Thr(GGU) m(6)t(6)A37 methyltransferase TsaA
MEDERKEDCAEVETSKATTLNKRLPDTSEKDSVMYRPIGIVHSPHTNLEEIPIQPRFAEGCDGQIEVYPEYADGLRDLDGFLHIYLLVHLHRAGPPKISVKPYLQDVPRGVFATQAPCRPNPIGLSIVRLERIEGCVLHVKAGPSPFLIDGFSPRAFCCWT